MILVATACASSSSATGHAAATSVAGSHSSVATSGSPIKFGVATEINSPTDSFPDMVTATNVAVKEINDAGGINGHPLDPIFCDSEANPNLDAQCGEEFVRDHVVAEVGGVYSIGTGIDPLEAAGIPVLAPCCGTTQEEQVDKNVFELGSGLPGAAAGMATALLNHGATSLGVVSCDIVGCQNVFDLFQLGLKSHGLPPAKELKIPLTNGDPANIAAQVISAGLNGVALASDIPENVQVTQALRQQGYKGLLATTSGVFDQQAITSLGTAAQGLWIVSNLAPTTDTNNSEIDQFLAQMKAAGAAAEPDDEALFDWLGVNLFATIAKKLPSVTAAALLTKLQSSTAPLNVGTASPPFVTSGPARFPGWSGIHTDLVWYSQVQAGQRVSDPQGFQASLGTSG